MFIDDTELAGNYKLNLTHLKDLTVEEFINEFFKHNNQINNMEDDCCWLRCKKRVDPFYCAYCEKHLGCDGRCLFYALINNLFKELSNTDYWQNDKGYLGDYIMARHRFESYVLPMRELSYDAPVKPVHDDYIRLACFRLLAMISHNMATRSVSTAPSFRIMTVLGEYNPLRKDEGIEACFRNIFVVQRILVEKTLELVAQITALKNDSEKPSLLQRMYELFIILYESVERYTFLYTNTYNKKDVRYSELLSNIADSQYIYRFMEDNMEFVDLRADIIKSESIFNDFMRLYGLHKYNRNDKEKQNEAMLFPYLALCLLITSVYILDGKEYFTGVFTEEHLHEKTKSVQVLVKQIIIPDDAPEELDIKMALETLLAKYLIGSVDKEELVEIRWVEAHLQKCLCR